ncbi:hypothetical protein F5Y16DRAFT_404856 [Xylariaceae sp. FL0255]|nr:hypothetical protein F5Y16DRAFT_404856 [Xylariaceae sp. FL0255]
MPLPVLIWGRDEYAPEFANSTGFLIDVLRALCLPLEFDAVFALPQTATWLGRPKSSTPVTPFLSQSGMYPQLCVRIAAAIHAHAAMMRSANLDHDYCLFHLDRYGTPVPRDKAELWLSLANKLDRFRDLLSRSDDVLVIGMSSRLAY